MKAGHRGKLLAGLAALGLLGALAGCEPKTEGKVSTAPPPTAAAPPSGAKAGAGGNALDATVFPAPPGERTGIEGGKKGP